MPADLRQQAKDRTARRRREAEERSQKFAAELAADRQWREEHMSEKGFALIAGEDSECVKSGTLRECLDAIPLVVNCRRNASVGIGRWEIVGHSRTVMNGKFDAEYYL